MYQKVWSNCYGEIDLKLNDGGSLKYIGEFGANETNSSFEIEHGFSGLFHGNGILILQSDLPNDKLIKYVGEFKNGSMNGQGVMYFKNGSKYEGMVNNKTFNGDGKLFSQDGSIEKEGYWENGKLVNKKTDKEKTLEKIKISSENKKTKKIVGSSIIKLECDPKGFGRYAETILDNHFFRIMIDKDAKKLEYHSSILRGGEYMNQMEVVSIDDQFVYFRNTAIVSKNVNYWIPGITDKLNDQELVRLDYINFIQVKVEPKYEEGWDMRCNQVNDNINKEKIKEKEEATTLTSKDVNTEKNKESLDYLVKIIKRVEKYEVASKNYETPPKDGILSNREHDALKIRELINSEASVLIFDCKSLIKKDSKYIYIIDVLKSELSILVQGRREWILFSPDYYLNNELGTEITFQYHTATTGGPEKEVYQFDYSKDPFIEYQTKPLTKKLGECQKR